MPKENLKNLVGYDTGYWDFLFPETIEKITNNLWMVEGGADVDPKNYGEENLSSHVKDGGGR